MKKLFIDAGNTRLKWRYIDHASSQSGMLDNTQVSKKLLHQMWKGLQPDMIWLAWVSSQSILNCLQTFAQDVWQVKIHVKKTPAQTGLLQNAYSEAQNLGIDRWCAMLACPALGLSSYALIDIGTAMTLDAVDANGQHLGGSILPGPALMQDALFEKTQLAARSTRVQANWLNSNTSDAISNGCWIATLANIEHFLAQLNHTHPNSICYLTGGAVPLLSTLLKIDYIQLNSPVLDGLIHWCKLESV